MSAKSFEEWRQLAKVAESNGMDVAAESHRLLADMLEQRAALVADRPEVAGLVERLNGSVCYASTNREWPNVLLQDAADALESLAAQLAEREAELAKVKALIDSHNEECRNLCEAVREKNACGYANYYPKKNCPMCSEDWIIAYPKDAP